MQIIDAQIHLWGTGLPSNLSHRQVTHFTPEEAIVLMDEGGVDAAVIHPPGWDPGSTDMAFKAVRDYPGRFAIMGSLPLDRPDSRARIAALAETSRACSVCGIRSCTIRRGSGCADGTLDWLWAEAEKAGVPIAMLATDSLTELGRIAERHPGTSTDDRSSGRPRRPDHAERCRGHDPHAGASGAGEVPQRGGQGDRRAGLFQRGLSVSDDAHVSAADLRCVRSAPHVLGHRHHQDAVLLAPMRDDVHRGTAVAQRRRTSDSSWARRCAPGGAGTGQPDTAWPTTQQQGNVPNERNRETNTKGKQVAVVVGATSKWQSDGRNTLLAHGKPLDDSDLPVGVRWGVGGAIAQKFAQEGFFVVLTTRSRANASALAAAIRRAGRRLHDRRAGSRRPGLRSRRRSPRSAATPAIRTC